LLNGQTEGAKPLHKPYLPFFEGVDTIRRVKERLRLSYINHLPLSFQGEGEIGGEVQIREH